MVVATTLEDSHAGATRGGVLRLPCCLHFGPGVCQEKSGATLSLGGKASKAIVVEARCRKAPKRALPQRSVTCDDKFLKPLQHRCAASSPWRSPGVHVQSLAAGAARIQCILTACAQESCSLSLFFIAAEDILARAVDSSQCVASSFPL